VIVLTCCNCDVDKLDDSFYKNSSRKSGRSSQCKECDKKSSSKHRKSNPIKNKKRNDRYYQENKQKVKQKTANYRESNKDKYLANTAVNNAIKLGHLESQPCEVCGEKEVHGHHESYLKEDWLNVNWLCHTHHAQRHLELRSIA
jgi:hypothetical protein